MKSLDYYINLPYVMELIPDTQEGGYIVAYPDLPGCLSCGETQEEALRNAIYAKKEWLQAALEEGIAIAEPEYASA